MIRQQFSVMVLLLAFALCLSVIASATGLHSNAADASNTNDRAKLFANDPSEQPTSFPTIYTSNRPSAQPTSHPSFVEPNVTITSYEVHRQYVTLSVHLDSTSSGVVYCGAFTAGKGVSASAVRHQANSVSTAPGSAALNVTNLYAITEYTIYCTVVTIHGQEMSLASILRTRKPVTTPCCREVQVSLLVHRALSDAVTVAGVKVAVEGPPAADLTAAFDFVDQNNTQNTASLVYPSLISWTSASNVSDPFPLTLISWGSSYQKLFVTLSGTSLAAYTLVYTESRGLTVLSGITAPAIPQAIQAIYSSDGTSILYYFDSPTDKGGYTNTFPCTSLLTFAGAASATCLWLDSATMTIYPKYSAAAPLDVHSNITVVPIKIRAECSSGRVASECSAWGPVPAKPVSIRAPAVPVSPTVIISTASVLDACSPLTIDLTNSVGAAGRPWSSATFTVSSSSAQGSLQLQNYLNHNYTLNPPTRIPYAAFPKGVTYMVQATLCNFLSACSSASTSIEVSASQAPVPIVTILGASTRSMYRSAQLSLSSNAYTQSCADTVSAANLQYTWAVRRVRSSGGYASTGLRSVSQSPTVLKLPTYALNVSATYEVSLTVTTPLLKSASTSVLVSVVPASVVAVVQGATSQYMKVGESIVIDASKSYDQDKQGKTGLAAGLSFRWECVQMVPSFSSVCPLSLSSATSPTLEVTSAFGALNTTTQLTLTVSSGSRTSTAVVTVAVADTSRPKLSITSNLATLTNVNTGKSFALLGQAVLVAPCAASWTVDDPSVSLAAAATTATSKNLVPGDTASLFNLVLSANALPQRSSLIFTLTCGTTSTSLTVTTNGAPLPGEFLVNPTTGSELSTLFEFSAQQWSDSDLPLTYQFGFMSETSLSNLVIVSKSEIGFSTTTLPAGLEKDANLRNCTLDVFDNMNAFSSLVTAVTVQSISAQEKDRLLLDLIEANTGSVDSTKNILSVVSTALNAVNCTAAPNCTTLHRASCVRTDGECGACADGYIGDAGDRSTLCIPAYVASEVANTCTTSSDCSAFRTCDTATRTCVTAKKACSKGCSGHGTCVFVSRTTGDVYPSCRLVDIDCDAVCSCAGAYSGEFCEISDNSLQTRRAVRSNLIGSLSNLTQIDDINAQSVSAWSASLYSLSIHPHELSENDVKSVAAIANATLFNAIALGVDSYADIAGVLQATDTVASLLRYNYNPNEYTDANFATKRNYENNTAAGTVNTVRAFADLVANNMVLGQNATTFVYDNFRMSVSVNEASAGNIAVSGPENEAETVVGVPPSTVSIVPNEGSPATVAVKIITVPPRSYRADPSSFVSTPLIMEVHAQGNTEVPSSYLSTVEFTMQNNVVRDDYIHYDVLNYTTVCVTENFGQSFQYTCPVSGEIIEHRCTRNGVHVSYCTVPAPGCAKLDVNSAEFAFLDTCQVIAYNSTYTTCSCSLRVDDRRSLLSTEENLLDDSGATCMMTSTVYIASGFANTFNSAGAFDSPQDLAQVVVVLVMLGAIWASGLFVIFYEGFVLSNDKNKKTSKVGATAEEQIQDSVISYVDSVIPRVFKEGGTSTSRIWGEVIEHHLLFRLFSKQSTHKRREMIFKTMSLFTFMLFLIAIFFDVSNPGDDGTCKKYGNEDACLSRVSPFDSQQNFCKWRQETASCAYNKESMTTNALFFLTVLTTVLTAIATIPLDFCFSVLSAPTVRTQNGSKVEALYFAMQAGVRRMTVGTPPPQLARIAPAPAPAPAVDPTNRRSMLHRTASEGRINVIANREIPDEITDIGESARKSIELVMKNNQNLHQRSKVSKKTLKARSSKRLTRMKSMKGDDMMDKGSSHSKGSHRGRSNRSEARDVALRDAELPHAGDSLLSDYNFPAVASLCDEIIQQRLLMNDEAEETKLFDAQWGVRKNESPDADELYYVTAQARIAIREAMFTAEDEANGIKDLLGDYTVQHAGLEILHLFMVDLLGRQTPAAKIFKEKFSEEFEDSRTVYYWQKVLSGVVMLGLNGFFIYYVLLKAFEKGYEWQIQFLTCFLLQFAVEVLIFETMECLWLNYSVPSFVRKEVSAAVEKLRNHVFLVTRPSGDRRLQDEMHALVDAPAHLFVSVKVAKQHQQLLESQIVSCYQQHLPGEICRTWPHYMALIEEEEGYVAQHLTWMDNFIRGAFRGLALSLQLFVTVPYIYQRVSIRFVQPMIFSGVTIVWFYAVGSPAGIGIMCGILAFLVIFFVWRWYESRQEATQALSVAPDDEHHHRVAIDIAPVPTFISDAADVDPSSAESAYDERGEVLGGPEDSYHSEGTVDTGDDASVYSDMDQDRHSAHRSATGSLGSHSHHVAPRQGQAKSHTESKSNSNSHSKSKSHSNSKSDSKNDSKNGSKSGSKSGSNSHSQSHSQSQDRFSPVKPPRTKLSSSEDPADHPASKDIQPSGSTHSSELRRRLNPFAASSVEASELNDTSDDDETDEQTSRAGK